MSQRSIRIVILASSDYRYNTRKMMDRERTVWRFGSQRGSDNPSFTHNPPINLTKPLIIEVQGNQAARRRM